MGKSRSRVPPETCLVLPVHASLAILQGPSSLVVDTHTHILTTYSAYVSKYLESEIPPKHGSIKEFVRALVYQQGISSVVDVWCESPMVKDWEVVVKQLVELKEEGFNYHFVAGCHPSEAGLYDDQLERDIIAAHQSPHCCGWGEIGLDYHYESTTEEIKKIQQTVLRRQLRCALKADVRKAITIHTREADEDILTILTEELPVDQKLHIHCFTDSPLLAAKLLAHFPNAFIGITGVISYSSNTNTASVVLALGKITTPISVRSLSTSDSIHALSAPSTLRILLESDAPFMSPANLPSPSSMNLKKGQRIPFSLSAMIPWTAEFVAGVLNETTLESPAVLRKIESEEGREGRVLKEEMAKTKLENGIEEGKDGRIDVADGSLVDFWTTEDVLRVARSNAAYVYGI